MGRYADNPVVISALACSRLPHARGHRLLQAPRMLERGDAAGRHARRKAFVAMSQRVAVGARLRTTFKRVNLIHRDATPPNLQCFM